VIWHCFSMVIAHCHASQTPLALEHMNGPEPDISGMVDYVRKHHGS
jgi:hypothetical protein